MVALFLTTTITCSQAFSVIQRIRSNGALPVFLKEELIQELRQVIPTCPIFIKQDEFKSK